MGFVLTANSNTLTASLTDYGKSILVGNAGGELINQIVKFGLRDEDIDYRRFTADTTTQTYGPCYEQSVLNSPNMEALSGTCFDTYPDIRGRYGLEVCDLGILQGPTTDGSTVLFNPLRRGNLWYTTQEDLEGKYCFSSDFDVTSLGLNEYGCKCAQFGIYSDEIMDDKSIKPGYPTYTDVVQMYNYTLNPRYFESDDNFKVGDFTGEGDINCDDFCWVVKCYTKGLKETNRGAGGKITYAVHQKIKEMMVTLGCRCEGYKIKPKSKGTFVCPANKKVYPKTDINIRLCENLMSKSNGDNKNLIQYVDNKSSKNVRNTNNIVKNSVGRGRRGY